MPYSPSGAGWSESWLGTQMSCVAVCEVIDDPSSVKCQLKGNIEKSLCICLIGNG